MPLVREPTLPYADPLDYNAPGEMELRVHMIRPTKKNIFAGHSELRIVAWAPAGFQDTNFGPGPDVEHQMAALLVVRELVERRMVELDQLMEKGRK